jgi:egghead protein (zeste-white 4 protein)
VAVRESHEQLQAAALVAPGAVEYEPHSERQRERRDSFMRFVEVHLPRLPPPASIFRFLSLLGTAAACGWLFYLEHAIVGAGRPPRGTEEAILKWASLLWAVPVAPALFGVVGLLLYRRPARVTSPLPQLDTLVCFRVVSRGDNVGALRATVANIRHEMAESPLFPYLIETVTDLPVDIEPGDDLRKMVVPRGYTTPNGSLYKARALQYALEVSPLPDEAWLMHLDEESHLTPSLLVGIQRAVAAEEASGELRIGQGAILYHRSLRKHTFLALADSIRTGDDLGRFYLQQRLGITLFGMHGSFILVRNNIEKTIGFDFGPAGSITEDAFWALRQMEDGRRSRWVDGYLVEQAPGSVRDFIRQRRRWFVGLIKVARHAPVRHRYRAFLGASVMLWSLSWLGLLYTYVELVVGISIPLPIQIAGNFGYGTFLALYVLGLKINLDEFEPVGLHRAACLYALQVLLMPVFCVLEAVGVVYGIVKPETGFHVIRKEHHA